LSGLGLDFLGYEIISEQDGLRHCFWELFDPNQPYGFHIIDVWKQIAFSARQDGSADAEMVARSINFALRASGLRLRDVSNQYHFQNVYAAVNGIKPGIRFMNVETFETHLNLHSMLVEMCSARDYLARFISRFLISESIPTMSSLYKRLKKVNPGGQLANTILAVCDKKSPDGWMARLGYFRDLVVHQSPIITFAERYVTGDSVVAGKHTLLSIRVGVPRDPITSIDSDYVDALGHFRQLFLQLLQFSRLAANASGIKPVIPHIDLTNTAQLRVYP
jgi:hypothetical protein